MGLLLPSVAADTAAGVQLTWLHVRMRLQKAEDTCKQAR
jgi:hypothetical protein